MERVDRPNILCFMTLPPLQNGNGGSQRAWALTQALAKVGRVHFAFLHSDPMRHIASVSLRDVAASVTPIPVPEWVNGSTMYPALSPRLARAADIVRIGTIEGPHLSRGALRRIAHQLPLRTPDVVFAGRLGPAVIADALLRSGLIAAPRKAVDFDDIMSRSAQRRLDAEYPNRSPRSHLLDRLEIRLMARREQRLLESWDVSSVCSDEDITVLNSSRPKATVLKLPNIVDRPLLPRRDQQPFRLLFVGNLGFGPNAHGLSIFLDQVWPLVAQSRPDVRMTVVGLDPSPSQRAELDRLGIELHANVPSVEPFYANADAVVAPIFFGGGTRIKILEAMAYGRPVVSTSIGAEGLDLRDGHDALIADDMPAFAAALIRLADDPALCERIAANARRLQLQRYGQAAMDRAVRTMILG